MESESRHQCLIYDGPPSHKLLVLSEIIQRKLLEGYRCLYLNSSPMIAGLRSTLAAIGVDVEMGIQNKRLILSSEQIIPRGDFDVKLMLNKLEATLDEALNDGYPGLWASGDMTWEFSPGNDFSKLMEYEMQLEELFRNRKELCGICQYHKDTLPYDALRQSLLTHSSVIVNQTLTRVNPHYLKSSWPADRNTTQKMDEMIAALCKE